MAGFTILDTGSFKKPVDVYLITNCKDDAYVCTSKLKADKKIAECPNYVVYEWPQLKYHELFDSRTSIAWQRPCKKVGDELEFDDTKTPWEMLKLAKKQNKWDTNRRFDSIDYAMEEYADRKYYKIYGYDIPIELETCTKNIWFKGFAGAEITDRNWLLEYKNKLHPNDDWTNVNLETYVKWIGAFDYNEKSHIIRDALNANVVGYLD